MARGILISCPQLFCFTQLLLFPISEPMESQGVQSFPHSTLNSRHHLQAPSRIHTCGECAHMCLCVCDGMVCLWGDEDRYEVVVTGSSALAQ